MNEKGSALYDEKADVLYITIEDAEGIAEHVDPNMLVRKSPEDGRVVGVTIVDFKKMLETSPDKVPVQEPV